MYRKPRTSHQCHMPSGKRMEWISGNIRPYQMIKFGILDSGDCSRMYVSFIYKALALKPLIFANEVFLEWLESAFPCNLVAHLSCWWIYIVITIVIVIEIRSLAEVLHDANKKEVLPTKRHYGSYFVHTVRIGRRLATSICRLGVRKEVW